MKVILKLKEEPPIVYEAKQLVLVRDNGFSHIKSYNEDWLNVVTFNDTSFEYLKWER